MSPARRPQTRGKYLVQVRPWSGPWRIVVRCHHLEYALTWLHDLKAEHPCVRVVHDGQLVASWQARPEQEA